MSREFKVILLGDKGVGKTSLARCQLEAIAAKTLDAESGALVYPAKFDMTLGPVQLNFWDLWAKKDEEPIPDSYYANADVGILLFDLTSRQSYKSVTSWYREARIHCDDIPLILCGNKKDLSQGTEIPPKSINFHRKRNLFYVETSATKALNVDRLIWTLVRIAVPRAELPEGGFGFASPPSLTQTFDVNEMPSWGPPVTEDVEEASPHTAQHHTA